MNEDFKTPRSIQRGFIFTEDGDLIDDVGLIENFSEYSIKKKKTIEAYKKILEKESHKGPDFRGEWVNAKRESLQELEESELTVTDRRYFMTLLLYAQFNGNPLYDKDNDVVLTNKYIADKIWGLHPRETIRRLNKFVELGLLQKTKVGRSANYFLNETYFKKGKGINSRRFVKLFQDKLGEVIKNIETINKKKNQYRRDKKPIDLADVIGLLHAVIPYFHFETYYLVRNPAESIVKKDETVLEALERNPKALKHLSKAGIGRVLGYKRADSRTIDSYMEVLNEAGAIMQIKGNKTRYLIHPDLMFCSGDGLDDYTKYVRTMFDQLED